MRWKLTAGRAETRAIVASDPLYLRDREGWEGESILLERTPFLHAHQA
ncbi:hypothetical protein [Streptomyces sp. NPDC048357]